MKAIIESEKEHEDPKIDGSDKIIKLKDWSRTMENIYEILRGHLGMTKVPLCYVVREKEDVVARGQDPAFGENNTKYESAQAEMIERALIFDAGGAFTPSYIADREKAWDIMVKITGNSPECWTYVKTAQKNCDGRKGVSDALQPVSRAEQRGQHG